MPALAKSLGAGGLWELDQEDPVGGEILEEGEEVVGKGEEEEGEEGGETTEEP